MKKTLAVSCILSLCISVNPLFAQSPKSESLPDNQINFEQLSKDLLKTPTLESKSQKSALPKEEEKPLVTVQESKIKVKEVDAITSAADESISSTANPVVVTATRNAQPLSQVGLPVTVINRKQIEQEGSVQALDVLRSVPGLTVVRSGARGRTTSLFLRGANANQTLFLVDGMPYSSPTTGFFDVTNLMLEDIERVEVIKGPQSDLYGSRAMGGVINIITRSGRKGRPKIEGRFEYGSEYSFYENGTVSGGIGPADYFANISRLDSDVGVAKRRLENDHYQDMNITGKIGVQLPLDGRLDTSYRFISGYSPIDDGAFRNDVNRWNKTKDNVVTTIFTLNPFTWLTETVKASYFDERLLSVDPADPATAQKEGRFKLDVQNYTLDWQNTIRPFESNTLIGGYQFEVQRADNRTFDRIIRTGGLYIQDQQSFFDRLFITAGARLEDNSAFGNSLDPKVSAAFLLKETKTKFKASFGTGFRTPTMNELFFPNFGNPNLQPEENREFDWGFEQQLPFFNSTISLDMYHSHYKNLIQAVRGPGGFLAQNTGKATMDGFELTYTATPIPGFLDVTGYWAYLMTKDKNIAGGELVRRPKNSGGVTANFHYKRLNLNVDATFVGNRKDRTFVFGRPPVEINKGYALVNLMLSYDLFQSWQIYGRAENITDADYDEVLGFQSSGALFFGGVKMKY